ncbi:hypothetical protein ACWD3J_44720 [Streptomyces sp. NPDC002755]
MEHSEQLAQLARCIEDHNTFSKQARDLWSRAQAESARIGGLVESVMSTGISWTELGTLLSRIDDTSPSVGPGAGVSSGAAPAAERSVCGVGADAKPHVPSQSAGAGPRVLTEELVPEGTPTLLFQAYSVVVACKEQEMASRDLAAALGWNPNTIGPDLCALLREVGVERSDGGKIRARYGENGKRLPGFTAACLKRALHAYAARASGSPATPA